jgi:hypothetical protein
MPRLFEIVPTTASIRHEDGSIEHLDDVMYMIGEDAEAALDAVLEAYDGIGGLYLDKMRIKMPGPWAYIALRKEYDIAGYIFNRRKMLGRDDVFKFTFYDGRTDISVAGFVPKIGCFLFFSKTSVEAAASMIRFLDPAWGLLRNMSIEKHWLVLLDEDPAVILREAQKSQ